MRWTVEIAILLGAVIVAASIMLVGRYDVAVTGDVYPILGRVRQAAGTHYIYRLDRWTGQIDFCAPSSLSEDNRLIVTCPVKLGAPM